MNDDFLDFLRPRNHYPPEAIKSMRVKARANELRKRVERSGLSVEDATITPDKIRTMRKLRAKGLTTAAIGKRYGLTASSVSVFVNYGSWAAYRAHKLG